MRNRFYVAREVLDEPDDGELAWKAIEPIWDSFDPDAELPDLEQSLRELTRGQRALFALDWCHKEVFTRWLRTILRRNPFEICNEEFFRLTREDDLERYRAAYVRSHLNEFSRAEDASG